MNLDPLQWIVAAVGAFLIGLSKTGIAGIGILAITLFTSVLPPRESVGLVLVLLICADLVAVAAFRRHAVWSHLWKLFPWTAAGVVLGWMAMGRVDDTQVSKLIGGILVGLCLMQLWRYLKREEKAALHAAPQGWAYVPAMGLMAGFTTMVVNAAGPIMILYLLAAGLSKNNMVGTGAWYFLIINLFKLPFSWSLGLINVASLSIDVWLAPLAVAGALSGKVLLVHINQKAFEISALSLTFLASLKLLFF